MFFRHCYKGSDFLVAMFAAGWDEDAQKMFTLGGENLLLEFTCVKKAFKNKTA